mgnify:CR=1 FL=1
MVRSSCLMIAAALACASCRATRIVDATCTEVSASTETVCGGGRIWPELAGWHPSISSHQEVSLGLEASVRAVSGQWDMCLVALASFPPPPPPCSRATAPLYVSREVEEDTVLKGIFSRQQSQKEGGFNTVGSLCLLCYALQPASTWCAG